MEQGILGGSIEAIRRVPTTMVGAGIEIYPNNVFFKECFPNIVTVQVDSTAGLMTQPLLKPASSLRIIAAVEECQLVAGISQNQLAFLLIKNKGRSGEWFIAHVMDVVRDEADEADSFVSASGERLVLRTVNFGWTGLSWCLNAYHISRPYEWSVGNEVISHNPSFLRA
jgi:hypothetical protein